MMRHFGDEFPEIPPSAIPGDTTLQRSTTMLVMIWALRIDDNAPAIQVNRAPSCGGECTS